MTEDKNTEVLLGAILKNGNIVYSAGLMYPTSQHTINSLNKHHGTFESAVNLCLTNSTDVRYVDTIFAFEFDMMNSPHYLYQDDVKKWYHVNPSSYQKDNPYDGLRKYE